MAEQVSGQLSKDYAIALVKLGDLARKRGAYQESTDYYNKALELGDRPEAFSALINLGRDAFRMRNATNRAPLAGLIPPDTGVNLRVLTGDTRAVSSTDPAKALEYFKRARNVANNGNDMGAAQTWMAMLRQSDPDGAAGGRVALPRRHGRRGCRLRRTGDHPRALCAVPQVAGSRCRSRTPRGARQDDSSKPHQCDGPEGSLAYLGHTRWGRE